MNETSSNIITQKVYSGSGNICAVVGCSNSQRKRKIWSNSGCEIHSGLTHDDCPCAEPFSLHSFPRNESHRLQWIAALQRKNYIPGKSAKVCSIHFVENGPTAENAVPQLHLGYDKKVSPGRKPLKRLNNAGPNSSERKKARIIESHSFVTVNEPSVLDNELIPLIVESGLTIMHDKPLQEKILNLCQTCQCSPEVRDVATQWEVPNLSDHNYYISNIDTGRSRILEGKESKSTQVDLPTLSSSGITQTDCLFYTGLNLTIFNKLLVVLTKRGSKFKFQLDLGDQFLLVLMRLRLGLLYADLARRFRISTTLASKITCTWLPMMAEELKKIIFWLPRETLKSTMPNKFRILFPKTTCIIDCTEVFIQRPTILKARAQTYSHYKSHNTLKFLVTIAPNGFVMHISKCFGGRASDKFICTNSGLLDYLLPGDEVMADRGFTIENEIAMKGATLNIPAFTKGKKQLPEETVTSSRRIASLRIHVERAIARIKGFRIFEHPSAFSKSNKSADIIVLVCAALTNLKNPLIKEASSSASLN